MHMKFKPNLFLILMFLLYCFVLVGCHKEDNMVKEPKVTEKNVETHATSVTFTWTVDYPGKIASVVEVSPNEDMSEAVRFGSETYTDNKSFTATATGLKEATEYYYRYVVWNPNSHFDMEVERLTTKTDVPKVKTVEVTDVARTTAKVIGEVTDDCGDEVTGRGICWSKSHNPTTNGSHLGSGTGIGTYSVALSNLEVGMTYYVRAYATNSKGTAYGVELEFVTGDAVKPTVTTAEVTDIDWRTATGGGEVVDDGDATVTERGICWSTNHNPEITDDHISNGMGPGSYTANMSGLSAGTVYYVRAYAKNQAGIAYGNEVSFSAKAAELPIVTTDNVTDISWTTATCGGNVTSDGGTEITERGICWSTDHNPTASDSYVSSGTGTGSFAVNMSGLTDETKYYVRSYAKNDKGINYGEEKSFTTLEYQKPTVETSAVTDVNYTTAKCGGNVTSDGGLEVTERGVCWSTNHNPTTNGSYVSSETGTGSFTVSLTGLINGPKYFVRAYAKNGKGINYGEEKSFITMDYQKPTVTTLSVTEISYTTAKCGGNVVFDGGLEVTERGICWSTEHDPEINGNHSVNGSGNGDFFVNLSELTSGVSYYVRAYAINSLGISYGEEKTFNTISYQKPTVITSTVFGISYEIAQCGGEVTFDGGLEVTECGVCWSVHHDPEIGDDHVVGGSGIGVYSVTIAGLAAGTTYYVRAYAINNIGTSYGDEVIFSTLVAPPEGAVGGFFSVGGNQQIYFSKGNLQYKASTNTWRFAENQFDFIGNGNSNASSTYNGWIDLFGWGTSGYYNNPPYTTSTFLSDYVSGSFNIANSNYDWGVFNMITNGGNMAGLWRTMTKAEWLYVIATRSTPSGIRYVKARVNNVNGLLLLPDDWSESYYPLNNPNDGSCDFSINSITIEQWPVLEQYGAVFLPASGYRRGTSVYDLGSYGYYWSSTSHDSSTAHNIYYYYNVGSHYGVINLAGWTERYCGHSVRLVRNIQ